MKHKFFLFTSIFILVTIFKSNSQIVNAKPDDFKEITKRQLIVQLITEDSYFTDDLEKKIAKTGNTKRKSELESELAAYRNFVTGYNSFIKDVITKFWLLNSAKPVEFKTFSQVQEIRKVNPKNFTLLQFVQTKLWVKNEYGQETFTGKTIPTLVYSRMENSEPYDNNFNKKIDYSFYFPYIEARKNAQLYPGDLIISVKMIQNHINEIMAYDKKNYPFIDFAKDQDDENCSKLKSLTLLLDEKHLDSKTNKQEITKSYSGNLNIISSDEIINSIEKEEDVIVSLILPYSIKSDKSGVTGLENAERIMYIKCFVNAKNANVYSCYGTKTTDNWEPYFKTQEFKKIEKCK
jgi:hypothetical protein